MAVVSLQDLQLFANDFCLLGDFFNFFCGENIGTGNTRKVYSFTPDDSLVIKIEHGQFSFDNVSEFNLHTNIQAHHKDWAKYLAPVIRISSCGKLMLQKRTTPIDKKKVKKILPVMLPPFLADTKLENWGMLNGKPVCHDYANHNFFANPQTKMVKAVWWSENFQSL
jgi:hypothetical protein